ncbi:hypothetical protein [Moraxella bovoculi]|uniref:hypothetical protein n=1 Tax=Moraxella bovoculi TaxID=386891 RepID=UPI0009BB0663|nr:hypothetical protein [Moraxella bovoculi]
MKSSLINPPHICPHSDCGQAFDDVIWENGIVFCPHCQRSILVNPITEQLQSQSFGAFLVDYFKRYGVMLLAMVLAWLVFAKMIEWLDIHHHSMIGMSVIGLIVIRLVIFVFGVYLFEKRNKKYPIGNTPILSGVDTLSSVQSDPHQSRYQERLGGLFYPFCYHCPHCSSQRIAQKSEQYHCQHCQTTLTLNPKPKWLALIKLFALLVIIFINGLINHTGEYWYLSMILVGFLVLIVFLVHRFMFIKTPKWIIK